ANYGFQAGLTPRVRNNGVFDTIRAIYYPANGTGNWFGDGDSYSNYGMIRKVSEQRTMTCSAGGGDCADVMASLTQQASIGAGVITIHQTIGPISDPDLRNKLGISEADYQRELKAGNPYITDDVLEREGCK